MSIRKVVVGLLITAGIAIMAVPFFWRATGEKQTEFIRYQYNEKAQERGNSLPRLYEIKISICKTGDICIV